MEAVEELDEAGLLALVEGGEPLLLVAVDFGPESLGGLAATFGGASSSADAIMGTRQAGNLLTKLSWWCGGIFIGLSFVLSLTSSGTSTPRSVLDPAFAPAPVSAPATTPAGGAASSVLPVQAEPAADAKGKAPAPTSKTP